MIKRYGVLMEWNNAETGDREQAFKEIKQLSDERLAEIWEYAKQTALNTRGGIVELCFARAIIKEITE